MEQNDEVIIKKREFEEKIVNLINNAGLPACVIRPILIELCDQTMIQEQQQYNEAMQRKTKYDEVQQEKEAKHEQNN